MQKKDCVFMGAAACALIVSTSAWATVEVLYCQVTGHAKAVVPAGAGLAAGTEFKFQAGSGFDRPYASPNGRKFFFTGLANLATTEDECYIVVDNYGASAATMMREGTTVGSPSGELLEVGNQRMGINNAGQFAVVVEQGAVTAVDKSVIHWDGASFVLVAREGGAVPGVAGETWGDGLNSAHVQADGTPLFCAVSTAGGLGTLVDDFCMEDQTIFIQSGDAIEASVWDAMNVSDFYTTQDGLHWMLVGDDATATTQDRILAIDGVVKVREGVPLPGSGFVSNVSASFGTAENILLEDGSYMVHGSNADTIDWAYYNGAVVAQTDAPIVPANLELYDDAAFAQCFFSIAANSLGDYVVGGTTNAVDLNANAVMVLNGTTVVARENDMVDLNGNGLADDDAFIGTFNNSDCFLTDDLKLVFFADVRNALLAPLGQMVLKIDINTCPGDIVPPGGDGATGIDDLLFVIANWGAGSGNIADLNDDGTVNIVDLLRVIALWGACPP